MRIGDSRGGDHRSAGAESTSRSSERDCRPPVPGRKMRGGEIRERVVLIGCKSAAVAAMAKFLRLWAGHRLDLTLVEPLADGGPPLAASVSTEGNAARVPFPYDRRGLTSRYGIRVVNAAVSGVDPVAGTLMLSDGSRLPYDRLSAAPAAPLNFQSAIA